MIFIPQKTADKGMNNVKKIHARALLDSGSLVGDFSLSLNLNALYLCYTSPIPLVVCSGLDGTCYSNDTIIDVGIKCKSLNNVCYTIYLTVRVNPTSTIGLILGGVTLTPTTDIQFSLYGSR